MENRKTLHIFCEKENGYSTSRIKEEAEKKGINVLRHVFNKGFVCENNFYDEEGGAIEIDKSRHTKVWFLSAMSFAICIARQLCFRGIKPFPFYEEEAFFLGNKFFANSFVSSIGIGTPKTCCLKDTSGIKRCVDYVGGFPCVIKKCSGSRGSFVEKVKDEKDIVAFVKKNWLYQDDIFVTKNEFLLQEFIADSAGTDFRIICFNDEVVGGMRRSSGTDNFKSNYSLGGSVEKFEVPDDLKKMAIKIMKEGKLFYAGLDFIKSNDNWLCIEININAQFQGFEKATGVNVAEKIVNKLFQD